MQWSFIVLLRLILNTLSLGPQLASSLKYSLLNLKHSNTRNMVMLAHLFNVQQYLILCKASICRKSSRPKPLIKRFIPICWTFDKRCSNKRLTLLTAGQLNAMLAIVANNVTLATAPINVYLWCSCKPCKIYNTNICLNVLTRHKLHI